MKSLDSCFRRSDEFGMMRGPLKFGLGSSELMQWVRSELPTQLFERLKDIDQLGQHLIRCADDLGIGLVSPLNDNHFDKFGRDIHIRLFQH